MTGRTILGLAFILSFVVTNGQAADSVYPSGYSITCRYNMSDTLIDRGDTLTVTRTVVNHESFPITGLYLSDNLPTGMNRVIQLSTVNGVTTNPTFVEEAPTDIVPGCNSYYWMVDYPDGLGGNQDTLYAGDSLTVVIKLTCDELGTFSLPLHTTVFYGNATGFFAIDNALVIRVQSPSGVDDPADDELLPTRFTASNGYPNPFNASARIYYEGVNLAGHELTLTIMNVLGQAVAQQTVRVVGESGTLSWNPGSGLSSGVYFYQLATDETVHTGKLVLMK